MKILCIGGTRFVGRRIVEDALLSGHEVYILQRGKTNAELFPSVRKFIGDRINIKELIPSTEKYDMVLDLCGYHPDVVKKSTTFLKDKTSLYVFISTCSVYSDFSVVGLNEKSKVSTIDIVPPVDATITNENYGPLKVLCENVVRDDFESSRYLILRPCIVVGTYDYTKRFDHLIELIARPELVVPNDSEAVIQFVDVRAISKFVLSAINTGVRGTYNTTGPKDKIRLLDFIDEAKNILNSTLNVVLSDDKNIDFPMYTNKPGFEGFFQFDGSKAYESGFPIFSISDTVLSTHNYINSK